MRSKPLRFSTPGACCLSGDAARHLCPSLSSQGDGHSIAQRWLSLAGVPVLAGGSLHAWHPKPWQRRQGQAPGTAGAGSGAGVQPACGAGVEGEDGKVVI